MQARSELMKFAVNESNKLGAVNTAKAKEHMRQAYEYGLKTIKGKRKVCHTCVHDSSQYTGMVFTETPCNAWLLESCIGVYAVCMNEFHSAVAE